MQTIELKKMLRYISFDKVENICSVYEIDKKQDYIKYV